MSRVTGKLLKQWLSESEFAEKYGMTYSSWNGYHYILKGGTEIIAAGKTPSECWREYTLYKSGYYLGLREKGGV